MDVRDEGRQRLYRLNGHALKPIHDWVKAYERTWTERFERLDDVLEDLKQKEQGDGATTSGTATVTLPTDNQILVTREFDAPGIWSTRPGRRPSSSSAGGAASAAR